MNTVHQRSGQGVPGGRILFIPVSGPTGIGEYMRSRIIAEALRDRQDDVDIRFLIARDAPYAGEVPFACFLTDQSPTLHPREVNRILAEFRPTVVVFDGAGRTTNVRRAMALGARTVWISTYRKRRRRGLKWGRLRALTEHWMVQPEFVDGGLSGWERLKCRLAGRPEPVFLGPILPPERRPAGIDLREGEFWLATAGGGGLTMEAENVSARFARIAEQVSEATGLSAVVVMGPNYTGEVPKSDINTIRHQVDPSEMVWLRRHARMSLIGGGSTTLLQTAAVGTPSVAVSLNKDQPRRIAEFERAGLTVAGKDGDALVHQCIGLIGNARRHSIAGRARELLDRGGIDEVIRRLRRLF